MTLPQRVSFSAQLSDCNVATCWQFELSKLSRLQLSTFIRAMGSVVLLSSFIPNQPLAGPCANLGALLACPVSTFAYFPGKACQGKPAKITFVVFMGQHWCLLLSAAAHHLNDNILVWMCPYKKLVGRGTEMVSALEMCWGKKDREIEVVF